VRKRNVERFADCAARLGKEEGRHWLARYSRDETEVQANLQKVRARVDGGVKTMTVCTSCIKAGKVVKA